MQRWVWGLGIGALLALSGCGGRAASNDKAYEGGTPPGAAGKPDSSDEDPPFEPVDDGPLVEPVVVPDQDGYEEHLLAAEIERIAGTSFDVLPATGNDDERGRCDSDSANEARFIGTATYHFRKASGGLELVASLAWPWLGIHRAPLTRSSRGWRVSVPTGSCLAPYFEEEEELASFKPEYMELVFSDLGADNKPTMLQISADYAGTDERPPAELRTVAYRDDTKPSLLELPAYDVYSGPTGNMTTLSVSALPTMAGATFSANYHFPWDLPRSFVFSEALRSGWSAALEDAEGNVLALAQGDSNTGPELGLDVAAYYPSGYRWLVQGEDLAGNPFETSLSYPSRELSRVDGTFEDVTPLARHDYFDFVGNGAFQDAVTCGEQFSPQVPCLGPAAPQHPETTALSGASSLWFAGTVFLRIARAPGATTVKLDALATSGPVASLRVGRMSLDPGTSEGLQYLQVEADAASVDDTSPVRTFTLPVTTGRGDLLVAIQAGYLEDSLGIDSLRTE